jgi:hypothetical protein
VKRLHVHVAVESVEDAPADSSQNACCTPDLTTLGTPVSPAR